MDSELKETVVVDDIIPVEQQDLFHEYLLKAPWYFLNDMTLSATKFPSYGFTSVFKDPTKGVVSDFYELVSVPIINAAIEKLELDINDIAFNRAFLQIPLETKFARETNTIHIDIPNDHMACVYYVNDADGDTVIYEQNSITTAGGTTGVELTEHKRVSPKKGRFVMFDGRRYHCSSQPKNGYRCIINFDLV